MTNVMKSFFAGAALLAFLAPTAAQAVVDFNYQSPYTPVHIFEREVMNPWKDALPETSEGTLQAFTFSNGGLVKPLEVIDALMDGTLDMSSTGPGIQPAVLPLSSFITVPFSTDNAIHATILLEDIVADNATIKAEIEKVGIPLTYWGADRAAFFSKVGPIKSVEDIKGKRVLVWNGSQLDQVRAWGGIPTQVASNDTYIALERGMGDIFYGPLPTGVANKFMEVTKDITPIPATTLYIITWASHDLWNYLSDEEKQYLADSVKPWGKKTGELMVQQTARDIKIMEEAGCTFYELPQEEIEKFKELAMPSYINYITKDFQRLGVQEDPKAWVEYIMTMSDKAREKMNQE